MHLEGVTGFGYRVWHWSFRMGILRRFHSWVSEAREFGQDNVHSIAFSMWTRVDSTLHNEKTARSPGLFLSDDYTSRNIITSHFCCEAPRAGVPRMEHRRGKSFPPLWIQLLRTKSSRSRHLTHVAFPDIWPAYNVQSWLHAIGPTFLSTCSLYLTTISDHTNLLVIFSDYQQW